METLRYPNLPNPARKPVKDIRREDGNPSQPASHERGEERRTGPDWRGA